MSHQKNEESVHRKGPGGDSGDNDAMEEMARKFASVMSLNSSKGLEDFDDDDQESEYLRVRFTHISPSILLLKRDVELFVLPMQASRSVAAAVR